MVRIASIHYRWWLIPFKMREQGIATEFMTELTKMAKKENFDIFLTPDAGYQEPVSKGGMSKGQITQWYKSLGLQEKREI